MTSPAGRGPILPAHRHKPVLAGSPAEVEDSTGTCQSLPSTSSQTEPQQHVSRICRSCPGGRSADLPAHNQAIRPASLPGISTKATNAAPGSPKQKPVTHPMPWLNYLQQHEQQLKQPNACQAQQRQHKQQEAAAMQVSCHKETPQQQLMGQHRDSQPSSILQQQQQSQPGEATVLYVLAKQQVAMMQQQQDEQPTQTEEQLQWQQEDARSTEFISSLSPEDRRVSTGSMFSMNVGVLELPFPVDASARGARQKIRGHPEGIPVDKQLSQQFVLQQRLLLAADMLNSSGHLPEFLEAASAAVSRRQSSTAGNCVTDAPVSTLCTLQQQLQQETVAEPQQELLQDSSHHTQEQKQSEAGDGVKRPSCVSLAEGMAAGATVEALAADAAAEEVAAVQHPGTILPADASGAGAAIGRGDCIRYAYGTFPDGYQHTKNGSAGPDSANGAVQQEQQEQQPLDLSSWLSEYQATLNLKELGTVGSCRSSTDLNIWSAEYSRGCTRSRPTTRTRTLSYTGQIADNSSMPSSLDGERMAAVAEADAVLDVLHVAVDLVSQTAADSMSLDFDGQFQQQAQEQQPPPQRQISGHNMSAAAQAPAELLEHLRVAEELLSKHGLLDAYLAQTQQAFVVATPSAASKSLVFAKGAAAAAESKGTTLFSSFKGSGMKSSRRLARIETSRLGFGPQAIFTGVKAPVLMGHAKAVSAMISASGIQEDSMTDARVHVQVRTTKKSEKDTAADDAKVPGPLETVWSPVAILVLLAYLVSMGYYMYVRFATAGNLGDQKWYGLTVLAVEMLGVTSMIPYGMMLVRYSRVRQKKHNSDASQKARKAVGMSEHHKFHVRVLVPCYKESVGTIQSTVEAALDADLPAGSSRTIYLCDDGKDADKRVWAATKAPDVVYVSSRTRAPGEINGKSGNLNNALRNVIYKDYESPADIPPEELVVVFDADMAAKKSFFVKVLEVMQDEEAALCLTPQAFHNVDAACDIWNHVNPQFWEYVLPGCDALGYVACTGTNVCLRARCLGQVGWSPEYTITEDYALSMELKMAGFMGRYLPEYLAVGEAPEEVRGVTRQRSRWTKGHMQVFFSRKCPLFNPRLSLMHKILYTNGTWAYFATICTSLTFTLVPFNSLVFGYHPVSFSREFTIASTAYLVCGALLSGFVRRPSHSRGMWLSGVSNNLLAFTYAKAVINTLLSIIGFKDKAGFKATVKRVAPVIKAVVVKIAELSMTVGRALSFVWQNSMEARRRRSSVLGRMPAGQEDDSNANTPKDSMHSAGSASPASSARRSSLIASVAGGVNPPLSPRARSARASLFIHTGWQDPTGNPSLPSPRKPASLNVAVSGLSTSGPSYITAPMSPRKTLQGLALLNSSPLSPRASGVDCGDAVKLLLSPQSPSEGRISAHAHGMNHLAGLHGSGVHGGVIGGHSTVAAAADGPVHGSGQTQSGQAAAEAEDADVSYWWSWAGANWESLDGVLDPLAIIMSLAISLFAIGVGVQQAVSKGSSFSLAHFSSIVKLYDPYRSANPYICAPFLQIFTSGRLDEFMLLAMLWAGVNCVSPILFLVYWWTKGRLLRWCCAGGQLLSLLLAAAAVGCLWLLVPLDLEIQQILPSVVNFLNAQRSGGELPNATVAAAYPWLQESGGHDPIQGGFYMGHGLACLEPNRVKQGYQEAGVNTQVTDTLKHGTDYLIRCHTAQHKFVVQIGDPAEYVVDVQRGTGSWGWPADMPPNRTMSVNTNSSMGGADALAAAAASLAAASVTFNNTDPNYAAEALQHSKQLYQMASSLQLQNHSYCGIAVPCQGSAVPLQESGEAGAAAAAAAEGTPAAEVAWVAYPSSSVYDDMAWAAAWLYKATGAAMYLAEAEVYMKLHSNRELNLSTPEAWIPSLDNMGFAAGLLLSQLLPETARYHELPANLLRGWMLGQNAYASKITHVTRQGFIWTPSGAPAHTVAGVGMLALLYAAGQERAGGQAAVIKGVECWAMQQVFSLVGGQLGDSLSYVIGIGPKGWPQQPYHRQASCPADGISPCNPTTALLISTGNPHQLTGALVAGPDPHDSYDDSRTNTAQSSVSLAGNVDLAGLLAGLLHRDVRQGQCNGGRGFLQNQLMTYAPK